MQLIGSIKESLSSEWHSFEALMASTLHSDIGLLNKINEYLLSNSGKKLRPILALTSAAAVSSKVNEAAITCAVAAEMMHTATLLHDDVVDESQMRRGSLTVRSLFSPGASVLMGDYWLSKVVSLLVGLGNLEIMELFSKTIEDLAAGEMLQMEKAEVLDTSEDDYYEIIRCKTASLFVSSIVSAAIASSADRRYIGALREYALKLGLLFQVRDDILDYSDTSVIGKDADCDISERKITLPLLCAFENAPLRKPEIISLLKDIDITNSQCPRNREIIGKIKTFVQENGGIDSARRKMKELCIQARDSLSVLPEGIYRNYLSQTVEILVS